MKGVDYAWWRPADSFFTANGIQFVSRYLSWLPNGKVLQLPEYQHLTALGLKVCLNWEFDAQDQKRGYSGGVADASEAYRQVRAMGIPEPFAVYFSADWDASLADFNNYIKPYLQGAASVLGGPRYVGVYGSYYTVKRAMEAGVAHYGWQTFAWSGGQWYAPAQVRQTNIFTNYDLNYSYADDFGFIGSITDSQTGNPTPPPSVLPSYTRYAPAVTNLVEA